MHQGKNKKMLSDSKSSNTVNFLEINVNNSSIDKNMLYGLDNSSSINNEVISIEYPIKPSINFIDIDLKDLSGKMNALAI